MVSCPVQIAAGAGPLHINAGPCLVVLAPRGLGGPPRRTMARHSKLQKHVLSLYRQFLRTGREKPGFLPRIQAEFRKNASIPRADVMHIEYLLRRGQRQLAQLRDANTRQMGTFVQAKPEEQ
ncbi:succinate dehydrogenase assembly factor 1, mitochondrial-like [Pelodiscus sinensis]|uniref:succinate dehydrogenase assembly factor 1, mitochondrial-like n=1 Tax=Pelodiscus sinensis TaxID=13735 RepID=UPI003F6D8F33